MLSGGRKAGPAIGIVAVSYWGLVAMVSQTIKTSGHYFRNLKENYFQGCPYLLWLSELSLSLTKTKLFGETSGKSHLTTLICEYDMLSYPHFPLKDLLYIFNLFASLQNGADSIERSEVSYVGPPGSGAIQAHGGEQSPAPCLACLVHKPCVALAR